MTQPTIAQLYNLTDRAGHGLTADEQQRLRDGIDQMHARLEAAERQPPPTTGTQPTPTHTHIWDGSRDLPHWLTGHHWTAGQLVIRTPDGDTRPQPGWWLIGWTDGSVTAATPTVAERVYGADGIAGRLARAEAALALQAQETATWRATANTLDAGGPGTPRARAEQAEAANDRIRRLAARIRQGVPWAANFDNLADRILAALDGEQPGPG